MMRCCFVAVCCLAAIALSVSQARAAPPKDVTVHLIPHSHCDPGYRKSFEGYYLTEVSHILTTLVPTLEADSSRRFVWEETSFFQRWWMDQNDEMKARFHALVDSKQLEFIGGGWVMNDEGAASYTSVMDQMTLGHQWLWTEFHLTPKFGWHIDPFGISAFTPTLFSQLGFEAFVINRIPDYVKQLWKTEQHLEFMWDANPSLEGTSMFTHVLDSHYSTPPITGKTVQEKANSLYAIAQERSEWYLTDNLLIPFGDDFRFQNATAEFEPMDAILAYIAANPAQYPNFHFRYSTLSEYFTEVRSTKVEFPTYVAQDFFPYIACYPCSAPECASVPCGDNDAFWTGYFTSKPQQKFLSYHHDAVMKVADTVLFKTSSPSTGALESSVGLARETAGLLQHHDAIAGTSFPGCFEDYNDRLTASTSSLETLIASTLGCGAGEAAEVESVLVVNSLGESRSEFVSIESSQGCDVDTKVESQDGSVIESQVLTTAVDPTQCRVFFKASVGALGQASYSVEYKKRETSQGVSSGAHTLSNSVVSLHFDAAGALSAVETLGTDGHQTCQISHNLRLFSERLPSGSNIFTGTNVYTFVPEKGSHATTVPFGPFSITSEGPLVWKAERKSKDNSIVESLVLHKGEKEVEIEIHVVGTLPDSGAHSLTSVFGSPSKDSNDSTWEFVTDDSGYQPMSRTYNHDLPLQGNTYPSMSFVETDVFAGCKSKLSLSLSQPHSVTSPWSGALELLVHRRLVDSRDLRGNDTATLTVRSKALFGDEAETLTKRARLSRQLQNPLVAIPHCQRAKSTHASLALFAEAEMDCKSTIGLLSVQSLSIGINPYTAQAVGESGKVWGVRVQNFEDPHPSTEVQVKQLLACSGLERLAPTSVQWVETTPNFLHPLSKPLFDADVLHFNPLQIRSFIAIETSTS